MAASACVLRRRGDLVRVGERGDEGGDFRGAHVARMAHAVEAHEAAHPLDVGALGAQAVVAQANGLPDGFKQRGRARFSEGCGCRVGGAGGG